MGNSLRGLSKNLRKRATNTENRLWLFLKNRQLEGVKFRRQEPIGKYIVDFVSFENKDGVLEAIRRKLLTPHLTSPSRGEEFEDTKDF